MTARSYNNTYKESQSFLAGAAISLTRRQSRSFREGLYTLDASNDFLAGWRFGFLQIRVFSRPICRVIITSEFYPVANHS